MWTGQFCPLTFIRSSFEGCFELFVEELFVLFCFLNSVHALCQSVLWQIWEKEGEKKRKEHSTVSLCKSGIKHTNICSLQRPLVHFPIQSRKLSIKYLWVCSPDPMPATHVDTCMCVCIHALNLSSKVLPFGNDEWRFQEPRCREDACMGFPSGYETKISSPGRYLSIVSIIFHHDSGKGTVRLGFRFSSQASWLASLNLDCCINKGCKVLALYIQA